MPAYRVLPNPGANEVFFGAAEALFLAELTLCLKRLSARCTDPRAAFDGGVKWYDFDADGALESGDLVRLSRLSFAYALFAKEGALLSHIPLPREAAFPDDLSLILKYTGKTNPLFTRLMLHMAELSLACEREGRLALLDPVAGRCTTLFEALMRGWDASGIELLPKPAHEAAVYFQKYLETEKWRHKKQPEKRHGAQVWRFAFARDKETLRENPGKWTLVSGDARHADMFYGKNAFDIVAGDLPYGVAHGNVAGGDRLRSPAVLLEGCLPAWRAVLRPGGVLALSWNTRVFPRNEMTALLARYGFFPLDGTAYDGLSHRVDASIQRDIAFAVK